MKKTLIVAVLCALSSLGLMAQKHQIRFNLPVGQEIVYGLVSHTPQTIIAQGKKTQLKNSMQQVISCKVVERKGENLVVDLKMVKSELVQESNGNSMKISSEDPENMYNKEVKALTEGVVRAEVTPDFRLVGEPTIIEGKGNPNNIFRVASLVFSGLYPQEPLAVGESFAPVSFTAFGAVQGSNDGKGLTGTITLVEADDEYFVFSGKFDIKTNQNGVDMTGPVTVNYVIDRKQGLPSSGMITSIMEGSIPQLGATFQAQVTGVFDPVKQ